MEGTPKTADVLYHSLNAGRIITNESEERNYFVDHVLVRLEEACLLKQGARNVALGSTNHAATSLREPSPDLGHADQFLLAGGTKTVPIEFKPTHNLLVPKDAVDMIRRYNEAVRVLNENDERTADLVNVGRPVAKTMFYMFAGGSRYGVLSSGTRSYFFKVEEDNGVARVYISDAWFIGQMDSLRAWVYLYHLATVDGNFDPPDGWQGKLRTNL